MLHTSLYTLYVYRCSTDGKAVNAVHVVRWNHRNNHPYTFIIITILHNTHV